MAWLNHNMGRGWRVGEGDMFKWWKYNTLVHPKLKHSFPVRCEWTWCYDLQYKLLNQDRYHIDRCYMPSWLILVGDRCIAMGYEKQILKILCFWGEKIWMWLLAHVSYNLHCKDMWWGGPLYLMARRRAVQCGSVAPSSSHTLTKSSRPARLCLINIKIGQICVWNCRKDNFSE